MISRKWPIVSDDPQVQQMYEHCRAKGESHNMAEICAFHRGPMGYGPAYLLKGFGTLADQFRTDPENLKQLARNAEAEGIALHPHGRFVGDLCRTGHPLDPQAVVPPLDSQDYVKHVCNKNGWDCQGAVTVKQPKRDKKEK